MRTPALAAAVLLAAAVPAWAALPDGAKAPTFTAQGSPAGKVRSFSLDRALENGPVVLYILPCSKLLSRCVSPDRVSRIRYSSRKIR